MASVKVSCFSLPQRFFLKGQLWTRNKGFSYSDTCSNVRCSRIPTTSCGSACDESIMVPSEHVVLPLKLSARGGWGQRGKRKETGRFLNLRRIGARKKKKKNRSHQDWVGVRWKWKAGKGSGRGPGSQADGPSISVWCYEHTCLTWHCTSKSSSKAPMAAFVLCPPPALMYHVLSLHHHLFPGS